MELRLDLEFPPDATRTEVWSFVVGRQWNVRFEGPPAVLPENPGESSWIHEFYPRPGEKLRLHIGRPEAADGATFAIDSVGHHVTLGKHSGKRLRAVRVPEHARRSPRNPVARNGAGRARGAG